MTEIRFGKDRYHEIRYMTQWCYEHIGEGGWLSKPEDNWSIDQAFGNSFFNKKRLSKLSGKITYRFRTNDLINNSI